MLMLRQSFLLAVLLLAQHGVALAQSFGLNLEELSGPDWRVKQVRVTLEVGGAARLDYRGLAALGRNFADGSLTCGRFALTAGELRCEEGMLAGAERWPLSFTYDFTRKALRLDVLPQPGEAWRLETANGGWQMAFTNAALSRLAPLVDGAVKPTAGRLNGTLHYADARIRADLKVEDGAFADAAGLKAGEKLRGALRLEAIREAVRERQDWIWQADLDWDAGAVFWDPVYLAIEAAGTRHRLAMRGRQSATGVMVEAATLDWHGVGRLAGHFDLQGEARTLGRYALSGSALALAGLRAILPQTWLDERSLGDLAIRGEADLEIAGEGTRVDAVVLVLRGFGLASAQRALALENLALKAAWRSNGRQPFELEVAALRVRKLAIGPIRAEGEVRDGRLFAPNLIAPMLDGLLALAEIEIAPDQFTFQGALTSVSMPKLTEALGWHPMGGDLSFVLPRVTYARSTLSLEGALLFKVFGGDARVERIRIDNPFGRTPRLTGNLQLNRMNLEEMTAAVKFGTISGFLDVNVEGLVMERWQPVEMDARVITSAGDFRKRVSQRAVQNISSIGGASAGAAIQRSFLGFFETFGYDRIGLSCRLRNGICEMGGVEAAAGGYALIKGGGVPSVNVVGYNRFVGWQELLDRIQAVIDGNSRPVFQ